MAKRKGKTTPDHYCDCGALLERWEGERCISCRYEAGEPGAVELVEAEQELEMTGWGERMKRLALRQRKPT